MYTWILRYLNKKPLCLQYNVPNSAYARRHSTSGSKRKERKLDGRGLTSTDSQLSESFIVVILCGIARLVQWAAVGFQQAAVDFLVKPAHELFPDEFQNQ